MTKRAPHGSLAGKPWLWVGAGAAVALGFVWSSQDSGPGQGEERAAAPLGAAAPALSALPSAPLDLPLHVYNSHLAQVRVTPDGSAVLAFGSEGAIWRSTDDGQTWRAIATSTQQFLAASVADARSGSIVVVGSGGAILRSGDNGQNFTSVRVNTEQGFRALAISADGGQILAVGDGGMAYVSRDAGRSFAAELTPRQDYLSQVVALPKRARFVVAGDNGALLLRDEGAGWREITSSTALVREAGLVMALGVLPSGKLLAGTQNGLILSSEDDGETWKKVYETGTDSFVTGFDLSETGALVAARMRRGDLLLSRDQGNSFATTSLGLKPGVARLAWSQNAFIGVALDGSVLSSDPSGQHWSSAVSALREGPLAMAVHPVTGTVILAGRSGFIARSTDRGKRYQIVRGGLSGSLRAFADNSAAGCLVGVGMGATVVHSLDAGETWQRVPLDIAPQIELSSVAVEPKSHVLLAAGGAGLRGVLLRSTDCARTWSPVRVTTSALSLIRVSETSTVLALAANSAVLRSSDAGLTFTPANMDTDASLKLALSVSPGDWVVAGEGGRIYRSVDDGKTFQRVVSGTTAILRALAYDPVHRALWLAGDAGTVLRSTDAGANWQRIAVPSEENLFVIGLHPAGDAVWLGGNHGTALRSTDQGQHFESVSTGSTQTIRVLVFDPVSKEFVLAGAGGTLLRTVNRTRISAIKNTLEGRIDAALFHAPSGALFLGGERLVRMGGS